MAFTDTPFPEPTRAVPTPPLRSQLWAHPRLRTLLHLGGLALLIGMIYFGMWRAYFASLDDFWITGWVRHRASLWIAIQGYGSGVRFLNYLPIWLKSQFFGLGAALYLWSALLQFLLFVWLVYGLIRQAISTTVHAQAIALLTAIFFAISYAHYEVVTYVSASDYTLWASCYVGILILFLRYLQRGNRWAYGGAVALYGLLAFGHDFTLNFPLVLLALHLTVGWGNRGLRQAHWRDLLPHLPFWTIWALHVGLQVYLVLVGTSEAVYSDNGYGPGLHMVSNLRYLIFLLIPNPTLGPIYGFLHGILSAAALAILWQVLMGLGILLQVLFIGLAARGSRLVRFGVALIYLPFLQYTPWHGHFIEAPRYLTLPSIGFALLFGIGLHALWQRTRQQRWPRRLIFAATALFIFANVTVIQIWVQQHIANGDLRRRFVTELATTYLDRIGPDATIWIEVPEEKYTDLEASCRLVFPYYVPCHAVVGTGLPPALPAAETQPLYWLKATPVGIVQRLPVE